MSDTPITDVCIHRNILLENIQSHFSQILAWSRKNLDFKTAQEYRIRCESLVEVVEVFDCGSIGGFDEKNPLQHVTFDALFNRIYALFAKYNDAQKLEILKSEVEDRFGRLYTTSDTPITDAAIRMMGCDGDHAGRGIGWNTSREIERRLAKEIAAKDRELATLRTELKDSQELFSQNTKQFREVIDMRNNEIAALQRAREVQNNG